METTKSKIFGYVLMFIGMSFYVFMIFSAIMQYSTVAWFIFGDLIGWHNIFGKICATFLMVYLSGVTLKFAPSIIFVLCAAVYIDVHFTGWSFYTVILLYIWPTLLAMGYCIKNNKLSIDTSISEIKNATKNMGKINASDE